MSVRFIISGLLGRLLGCTLVVWATSVSAQGVVVTVESCGSCHGGGGVSQGEMPGLAGQDADVITQALRDFRDGRRAGTIMGRLVGSLNDRDIAEIAAYFAQTERLP